MIAFVMIMRDVLGHGLLEVPLAERNDAIETFLFDGPDEALSVGICIGRLPRRLHNMDAGIAPASVARPRSTCRVPITNQYAMRAQQPVIVAVSVRLDLPHEQTRRDAAWTRRICTRREARSMTNTRVVRHQVHATSRLPW